jgi:hypothetical protein
MHGILDKNAWVGQEVTVLYDPKTRESIIYKYCKHGKLVD